MLEIEAQIERMNHEELQELLVLIHQKLKHESPQQSVTQSEREMLAPRVEEALQNPMGGRSWAQVKTSLLEQAGEAG